MSKRVPLHARREKERKGVDAIVSASEDPALIGEEKGKLTKVTLYVRPEQVVAIEEIQLRERQRSGRKPNKSELIQEALELLIEKYSNTAKQ